MIPTSTAECNDGRCDDCYDSHCDKSDADD